MRVTTENFLVAMSRRFEALRKREKPPIGIPAGLCTSNLFFGFFFDGTENNYKQAEEGKNHSNVANSTTAMPARACPAYCRKVLLNLKGRTMPKLLGMGCLLLGMCLVASCAEKTDVDVNLHGVNYGGDAFSYYVMNPAKPKSGGAGGELINAFEAGGTTCCFTLPRKWRPGIKVQVHTSHWLPETPDGRLPEVKKVHIVDVPAYSTGVPGEIWIIRAANGSVTVISSDFQPDHPKWPGKVKGWPVPSLEYRRERWKLYKQQEEMFVSNNLKLLDKIEKSPKDEAKESWEFAREYNREEIEGFSGPDDPHYVLFLKQNHEQRLADSRERLRKVMEMRP